MSAAAPPSLLEVSVGAEGPGRQSYPLIPANAGTQIIRRGVFRIIPSSPTFDLGRGIRRDARGRGRRLQRFAAIAFCLLAPIAAQAADIHGRLEVQGVGAWAQGDSAPTGDDPAADALANLRLTWEPSVGPWSLSAHYLITADAGDSAGLAEAAAAAAPPSTWLDLTGALADDDDLAASHRIDRLAVTYASDALVVRAGRQALTWGSGLVFRPMDLFNPFSPAATDTEYKPGVDMLYVQRLFGDGSDLQLIAVPRQTRRGAGPTADASSAGFYWRTTVRGHGTTLLVARDHGDWLAGLGVSGALGEAAWNVEIVPLAPRDGDVRVSALANLSTAVTLLDRNATVFGELFHSGLGEGGDLALADLPPVLGDRLARGQLFTLRRNYLAGGVTLEVNPLLTTGATLIADLDDASALVLASATWSLGDNAVLIGGVQLPVGGPGTEYGGLPATIEDEALQGPPIRLYVQLRRYF